jgi:hypothetical protein
MGKVSTGYPLSTDFFRQSGSAVTGGGGAGVRTRAKGDLLSSYARSGLHVALHPQKRGIGNSARPLGMTIPALLNRPVSKYPDSRLGTIVMVQAPSIQPIRFVLQWSRNSSGRLLNAAVVWAPGRMGS